MAKNIKDKLVVIALAGSLGNSGCLTYTTMPLNFVPVFTVPIGGVVNEQAKNKEFVDYSKLTWQEAIDQVQTPEQAQEYLDQHFSTDYDEVGWHSKGESFKYNHSKAKGNCLDYATVAAALLSDNGYSPILLAMSDSNTAHAVYLYRTKEG
ncbi:MAG: transglutaminase-like domain-containing protein [Nanoarchaeota archaeon]